MTRSRRKPLVAVATLSALVLLAGIFPGLASSAPAPSDEVANSDTSLDARALFERELSAKRSTVRTASNVTATPKEVDIDRLLESLPESARASQSTRQQLIESLNKSGFKALKPEKFRNLQENKTVRNLDFPPRSRIINGAPVSISTTRYQVALVYSDARNDLYSGLFCGGSIIAAAWILTAAHCVDTLAVNDLLVVSGIQNLPSGPAPRGTTASAVKSIIIHPQWKLDGIELHDVALLELTRALRFGPNVQPVDLADSTPTSGNAFVSGWGVMADGSTPRALQGGQTPIVACPEDYYTYFDGEGEIFYSNGDSLVCAGSSTDSSQVDACYGDSGGPLVRNGKLIGVVSFGPDCPPGGIGAYANVNYFSGWIMCHVAIANPFGGPYFCGDEAYWITVGDTLRVAKGSWGGRTATFQWFADSQPISRQTRNFLPLTGMYGKRISVRISSPGFVSQDYNFSSYQDGLDEIHDPVQMGVSTKVYPSGDFVPCTAVNYQPPNRGSCSGTAGQENGSMQSTPGFVSTSPNSFAQAGFWAYRDIALPANTVEWAWGIVNPWSRGEVITGLKGDDGFIKTFGWNEDVYDYYAGFGAPFFGTYGTASPLVFDEHWSVVGDTPFLPNGVQPPFEQDGDGYDIIPRYLFGPINEYRYDPDTYETILDNEGNPVRAWSQVTVNGKGRVVMGTFGSELLGTRLTFDFGLVMAYFR